MRSSKNSMLHDIPKDVHTSNTSNCQHRRPKCHLRGMPCIDILGKLKIFKFYFTIKIIIKFLRPSPVPVISIIMYIKKFSSNNNWQQFPEKLFLTNGTLNEFTQNFLTDYVQLKPK